LAKLPDVLRRLANVSNIADICETRDVEEAFRRGIDSVINFAAESHVDRSILDARPFVQTNVAGTQVLLELARRHSVRRFVQVSTDEVYGPAIDVNAFDEDDPLRPTSPYAASKAAADLLCLAYHKTFGVPVVITRCTNNYGPFQFPEKFIQLMITNVLEGKPVPIYGDGRQERDWLFVEDHCTALLQVLEHPAIEGVFNIAGGATVQNLRIAQIVLNLLGASRDLLKFVPDRPAHDRRYALHADRIAAIGWQPQMPLEAGLSKTVAWFTENQAWWRSVKSGEYLKYYSTWYEQELLKGASS